MVERYVSNPRHKAPWQPGARGTQCPRDVDGEKLFGTATADPKNPRKKYNTDGTHAYCAHSNNVEDKAGNALWHGFPVNWRDVPGPVQRIWLSEGRITRLRLRG